VKTRHAALLLAVYLLAGLTTPAGEKWKDPFIGEWSNGRGETLVITSSNIKFGNDKPVSYHDITRVTDGKEFNLQITAEGDLNYLTRFLHISIDGEADKADEMKITLYDSRKDLEAGQNSQGEATWYRDKQLTVNHRSHRH
jgi:hypothetical protein